jgi:hypothetical protein
MQNAKTKVISVIIWATGTIAISFGTIWKTDREITKSRNYRKQPCLPPHTYFRKY